ncbi:MAG: hypothetical protein UW30_C0010G0001 [Candidatus Giovannonibacteria bacterium GW2011_GWA2_44_13b]|uniref:Antitoxin n=1 Tax=Candidatus Giovannonibacteria bacterium GW2011_GWA2_44_13b TaxID=1618647 RepID=A0A0G1H3A7_9BACT|nr:MAG: hypothetical protein UW30_C0010G0001 [Candidatus Giovannonibacteria bacterium GW2011_GWA2_44_13b]
MTIATISRAIKMKKPAILKEGGVPRYVVLDWDTYRKWEDAKEDIEDIARLNSALSDPKNQKRIRFSAIK